MFALLIKERNLHNLAKREGRMMGKDGRGPLSLSPSLSLSLCLALTSLSSLPPRASPR